MSKNNNNNCYARKSELAELDRILSHRQMMVAKGLVASLELLGNVVESLTRVVSSMGEKEYKVFIDDLREKTKTKKMDPESAGKLEAYITEVEKDRKEFLDGANNANNVQGGPG